MADIVNNLFFKFVLIIHQYIRFPATELLLEEISLTRLTISPTITGVS